MHYACGLILAAFLLAGCGNPPAAGVPEAPIPAAIETEPTVEDGPAGVAIWVHPTDPSLSLILGAGGTGGLETYDLAGNRLQVVGDREATQVALRYGFDFDGKSLPLVLVHEPRSGTIAGYTIDEERRIVRLPGAPFEVHDEATGICTYRSPITGRVYLMATTDNGLLLQWELYEERGALQGRLVRTVPLGKGAEYCAVDDASGLLFYADETLGVFVLGAEPEADTARVAIDLREPFGGIAEEAKGIAVISHADGGGRLIVADASAERFAVYTFDGELLGRFTIGAGDGVDGVGEAEGIAIAPVALGGAFPGGLFVVSDEDNDDGFGNFKLVGWREIQTALGLAGHEVVDPREVRAPTARTVTPVLATPPADTFGDASDDPAIWVHPRDPERSVVIGTDKNLGLYVYDLDGRVLQTVPDGRLNNVDVRDGFRLGDREVTVVAASNRTDKSIALYLLDHDTRRLTRAGPPVPTGLDDPYGLCMYVSAQTGGHYVFVNDPDGRFRQWRLRAAGGQILADPVRNFHVGGQAEGCVADDELGNLYVPEEDGGFWKYSAEVDGGDMRFQIDRVGGATGLVADIEGVAIWHGRDGRGYIVLSNQGADNYAVYRREGDNEFVGMFHIVADPARGIDGVSETDGLEVTSRPLGPRFPDGLLVVQDGRNLTPPAQRQNFKFVSWRAVAEALGLNGKD